VKVNVRGWQCDRVWHAAVEVRPDEMVSRADYSSFKFARDGVSSHVSNLGRTNRED
jgi:hypothetical protein